MNKSLLAVAVASLCSYTSFSYAQEATADETVVVTANRFDKVDAAVLAQTVVITKADIERLQAVSLVDVFKTLPSVEITQYGGRGQTASIYVRGGSSSQVLVLVDGVRMPRAMMGGVDFNQIPVSGIERIEYIRGARASIYGSEAISGVINIITRANPNESKNKVHAGFGSNNHYVADASVSQKLSDDKHIKAVVGYEKTDGFNVHPVSGLNDGDEHGFESYHAQLGYQQQLSDTVSTNFGLTAYNNQYDYDNSYSSASYSSYEKDTGRVEYRGGHAAVNYNSDKLSSEFNLSYGTQDNYNFNALESKNDGDHVAIEQTTTSWLNSYKVDQNLSVGAGVDFRREKLAEGTAYGSSYEPEENPRDNIGFSALGQYQYSDWTAEASIRSDDNSQYGQFTTWHSALGWQFTPAYEVVASYGTAFRAPSFVDLYYPGYESPDLKPEESKNVELSLNGYTELLDWSVTLYKNQIDNMLMWDSTAYKTENIGKAEITGIELGLNFDTEIVKHQIYLDYKDPVDKSDGEDEQLTYRSKRGAKWNASAQFGDWTLGSQYLYQGERYNSSGSKLSGYSLWNFTAEYAVTTALSVKGKLSNAFDKDYELISGYATAGREYMLSATYQF